MHRWLAGWVRDRARKATIARPEGERHVLVAVCDHFEPLHGRVGYETGLARVRAWRERYPVLASRFRDSDGRAPRHTFFFPGEEYHPDFLEPLAELVRGRARRDRGASAPRRRHPRVAEGQAGADALGPGGPWRRALDGPARRTARLGVHPRQLGPRERPTRRTMVRGRRRARAPPRAWLLRRLHLSERSRPVPAVDRQPHLLSARRRAAPRLRLHGARRGPARRHRERSLACCSCKGPSRSRGESPIAASGYGSRRAPSTREIPRRRRGSGRGSISSSTWTGDRSGRS